MHGNLSGIVLTPLAAASVQGCTLQTNGRMYFRSLLCNASHPDQYNKNVLCPDMYTYTCNAFECATENINTKPLTRTAMCTT